jgi:titin
LTWTGSSGATSYKIQRSLDGSTSWTQVGTSTSPTTAFADNGLASGTTYYYRVLASNGGGDSTPSNTANAATNPTTAPSAPTNLTARSSSSSKIALSWGASAGATSYPVERSLDGLAWTQVGTATGATSYVDSGLAASTTYHYRVRASNSGGVSPYGNIANATTMKKGK